MGGGPLASVYLLAAGRGSRAGGPKAFADLDGKPLLERQMSFLTALVGAEDVLVAVQESWLAKWSARFPGARLVAVDPDAPPLASLIALVAARKPERPGFVLHVDMPLWEPRLYAALLSALRPGWDAVVPRFEGRRGHPVLASAAALSKLGALDPAVDRLDVWLRSRKVETLDVPFSCVTQNWNYGVPR